MPEGAWRTPTAYATLGLIGLAVLAYLVWDLATVQAERRLQGEDASQAHIQYAEDQIAEECVSLNGDEFRDCVYEQIASAQDHRRAEQDLKAQQDMALFTRIMGYTAVAGALIGSVSLPLIFFTLKATQAMAADQRRIGEAQVQAYLSIEDAWCFLEPDDTFGIWFAVKNYGQSPARDAHFVIEYRCLVQDEPNGSRYFSSIFSFPIEIGNLPANSRKEIGPDTLRGLKLPQGVERIADGSLSVGSAEVAVFAADVFDREVFAVLGAPRAPDRTGPPAGSNWDFLKVPFGPSDALKQLGWSDEPLRSRRPKR